jgi:hypothetical protein
MSPLTDSEMPRKFVIIDFYEAEAWREEETFLVGPRDESATNFISGSSILPLEMSTSFSKSFLLSF